MRSLKLSEKLELDFHGNVWPDALYLGDVDNDGLNELVVGNIKGEISVFKYKDLWQKFKVCEMIASVAVGDVMNCGSNSLVVITANGWCYLYLCLDSSEDVEETTETKEESDKDSVGTRGKLQLVHKQRIPANTKVMILGDLQGNGEICLILGLTDRVVRIYKWKKSVSECNMVCLCKTEVANQIGSLSIGILPDTNQPCVLVSQPGNIYLTISYNEEDDSATVDYHPFTAESLTPLDDVVVGQIIGCFGKTKNKVAIVSAAGHLTVIENRKVLWRRKLEQKLFTASRLNCTKENVDNLIICGWSGTTYVMDDNEKIISFKLNHPMQAFTAGIYTQGTASLIYVTLTNKIIIYPDIYIKHIPLLTFDLYNKDEPDYSFVENSSRSDWLKFIFYYLPYINWLESRDPVISETNKYAEDDEGTVTEPSASNVEPNKIESPTTSDEIVTRKSYRSDSSENIFFQFDESSLDSNVFED